MSEHDPGPASPDEQLEPQMLLILVGLPGAGKSTFSNALVAHASSADWGKPSSLARPLPSSHLSTPPPLTNPRPSSRPLSPSPSPLPSPSPSPLPPPSPSLNLPQGKRRRKWVRASQDEAPSRRRQECENCVRWGLDSGFNVVVDRVDFDPKQRSHFVSIADQHHPRPRVHCLVLAPAAATLQDRLVARPSHPTIPDAETGLRVLAQMQAVWDPPRQNRPEGFDRVFVLGEQGCGAGMAQNPEQNPEQNQEQNQNHQQQHQDVLWTADQVARVLDKVEDEGWEEIGERKYEDVVAYAGYRADGAGRGDRARGGGHEHRHGHGYGRGGSGHHGYGGLPPQRGGHDPRLLGAGGRGYRGGGSNHRGPPGPYWQDRGRHGDRDRDQRHSTGSYRGRYVLDSDTRDGELSRGRLELDRQLREGRDVPDRYPAQHPHQPLQREHSQP